MENLCSMQINVKFYVNLQFFYAVCNFVCLRCCRYSDYRQWTLQLGLYLKLKTKTDRRNMQNYRK